jgi:AcrR family transcriptional regulator
LALFNERSFADTTMEQIARRAGASTKTLYARYADKAEMVEAVVNRIIERSLAAHAMATSIDPRQVDPRVFIISLGTQIVMGISGEGAGLINIALSEARRFPVITKMYNATLSRGRGIFRNALEIWHQDGLLPDLVNPEMASMLLISILTDMARIRTAMGEPMTRAEVDAFIPYAADIFLRGCGYRSRDR